jgi:hypothetical protein
MLSSEAQKVNCHIPNRLIWLTDITEVLGDLGVRQALKNVSDDRVPRNPYSTAPKIVTQIMHSEDTLERVVPKEKNADSLILQMPKSML